MTTRWIKSCVLAILALLSAAALHAQPVPTELVHRAMDQVLVEMDNPFLRVIKQGSWITGENFRNPLTMAKDVSDFDARLYISIEDVTKAQAEAAWATYQQRLVAQYTAMDANLSKLNSLSTYLTQQLASLSANSSSSSK